MKKNYLFILTIQIFFINFFLPLNSKGQDGSLDLTFGINGFVTTTIGATDEWGVAVAIQIDGKIVVAGNSENGPFADLALTRYNSDGSLDTTFDADGKLTTPLANPGSGANDVVIQSDGKIVIAGTSSNGAYNDFLIVRYNIDGSLDTTFDADGILIADMSVNDDMAKSLVIQNDGKIVVAGISYTGGNSFFTLARFNDNGSLDTTFDTDGKIFTSFGNTMNLGYGVALQTDGKIVVAGQSGEILGFHTAVARYNTDGSLDSTFDADGKVTTAIELDYDGAFAIAIQSDGNIVVAGFGYNGNDDDFTLVRYHPDGSLDSTFDGDGKVTTLFGPLADTPNSVVIQNDGKIIAAGYSILNDYHFALARYNSNGSLDTTFDTDGKVTTLFGPYADTGSDIALQSDGKIVMVGNSVNSAFNSDFAVVRYNNTITTEINNIDNRISEIKIYPNPFSRFTTIKSDIEFKDATLTVFNLYGQQVKQLNNIFGNSFTFHRDNLPNGIYFIRVIQDKKTISANKFIISD